MAVTFRYAGQIKFIRGNVPIGLRIIPSFFAFIMCAGGCIRGSGTTGIHSGQTSSAAPTALTGWFRNTAEESGISFRWGHGGKTPLNIIETLGHGCAFLDFDQDGMLDALLVGNRRCSLFRNLGNGRFADVSRDMGLTVEGDFYGVAVGDYDNDGFPDVYITGYGKCVLYHNLAGKRFEDVTVKAGVAARGPYDVVTAAAFVDIDGDGKLDLFAGRYIRFSPSAIHFCDYGGVRAGCGVKNYEPDAPQVFRNLGGGRFANATKEWGFESLHGRCLGVAICAADTGSGVTLYAANDELAGDLMVRQGGKYVNIGVSSATAYNRNGFTQGGMGVDWGDFNNDGRPDLVVMTFQKEPSSLYRNDGAGLFSELGGTLGIAADTTQYVGWTAKFVDIDNDGWQDLFMTSGHSQDNAAQVESGRTYAQMMQLYHNEGGREFRLMRAEGGEPFMHPIVGRGAAVGDYDNDGRMDLLVVDEEGSAKLLHNEHRSSNHWLGVRLHGVKSNRDGIGARVTVKAGGKTYVRDQQLCGGYISAHDPRVHFGLGSATKVEKLMVRWPNGNTDSISNIPSDQYVTVMEGHGRNSVAPK